MIRLAAADERRFVASSWVKSYASSEWARFCTPPPVWPRASGEYFAGHNRLVDVLIARALVRVVERDGIVAGWSCTEGSDVVHYVYVRQLYRREGIARALLEEHLGRACVCTHRARFMPPRWRFDPYLAFMPKEVA